MMLKIQNEQECSYNLKLKLKLHGKSHLITLNNPFAILSEMYVIYVRPRQQQKQIKLKTKHPT